MAFDHSCIAVITGGQRESIIRVWYAIGAEAPPAQPFVVACAPLVSQGEGLPAIVVGPATHYLLHDWREHDMASKMALLGSGTLPEIAGAWEDFGLTLAEAQAAVDALTVTVMTGASADAITNMNAALGALGLGRYEPPSED